MRTGTLSPAEVAAVIGQIPSYVTAIGRDGTIRYNNRYLGGHAEDGTVGQMADFCLAEEFKAPFWAAFWACRDRRIVSTVTSRVLHPEPPGFAWMACTLSPVVIDCEVKLVVAAVVVVDPPLPATPKPGDTPAPLLPVRPARVPASARWLSPLCERIVACLAAATARWTPCDAIAERIGEPVGHRLKAILANLVERGIVEASAGAGYRLADGG